MKKIIVTLLLAIPLCSSAQNNDSAKAQEKFVPIRLFFVMLVKGPNRDQDSATAAQLQAGHMANITKMSQSGKLLTAGPFLDDGDWRGIFILKCNTREECEALVAADPAVAAGRLKAEIHPWMTGQNCLFK